MEMNQKECRLKAGA